MPRTFVLSLVLASTATAQVTRRDLADAYMQVDALVEARGFPMGRTNALNRAFDQTTLRFFGGDYATVLRDMHRITAEVAGDSSAVGLTRRLLPLRVRIEPRTVRPGAVIPATIVLRYADTLATDTLRLVARLRDANGRVRAEQRFSIAPRTAAGTVQRVEFAANTLPRQSPARFTISVEPASGATAVAPMADGFVLAQSADSLRATLDARSQALTVPAALAGVVRTVRARIALLTDRPSDDNSAQFLADLAALARDLPKELDALTAGRDPYVADRTDRWRTLAAATGDIPFRIVAPKKGKGPFPLVIALHGAGGDENHFFEGYGDGILTREAERLGFVAIAPATIPFQRGGGIAFDSLVALIGRELPIDTTRIFVLGHSAGAGTTMVISAARASRIRGAAAIAGFGAVTAGTTLPPLQVVAAAVDGVIPAARIRPGVTAATAAGATIAYSEIADYGHSFVVGKVLPSVLDALLRTPAR
ncbi:MAG: hypothetical protein K2X99_02140 [Gemmatimonadaceae bacterium]|nr:hypothetical protein [Gemmatimonadaceae bacterium]